MITRRTVIKGGISASLAMVSAFPFPALSQGAPPTFPFHALLFDGRYEAGRQFGQESARSGMKVHDIGGDVTRLWYQDLRHHWKGANVAVAGLTTFSSFFSLRMMTDAARIRPQYLGYHHLETGVRHEVFGPESFIRSATFDRPEQWPSAVARLVLSWSHEAGATAGQSSLGMAADRHLAADSLVSWIFASKAPMASASNTP